MSAEQVPSQRPIPLVESVLAFTMVRQTTPWDSVFFGKLHDRLQDRFPSVSTLFGAQIRLGDPHGVSLGSAPELKRFSRADGGMTVVVGSEVVGVSILARKFTGGYPGWEHLLRNGLDALRLYVDATRPDGIQQVGVRYINSIEIEPTAFQLADFVAEGSGLLPNALLSEHNPFTLRIERIGEATAEFTRREVINLVARGTATAAELVLDVDQQYVPTPASGVMNPAQAATLLHDSIRSVFQRIVSPRILSAINYPPASKETTR